MRHATFDLDGTLCITTAGDYANASPRPERIAQVNALYDAGYHITIDTARGSALPRGPALDALAVLTADQVEGWRLRYHTLRIGDKPFADVYVGDEAVHADDFFTGGHPERWPDEYFAQRHHNDPRRLRAFAAEADFLQRHSTPRYPVVCDVGCGTGEFMESIGWAWTEPKHSGCWTKAFGMEINSTAQRHARLAGISFDRNILTERDFFDVVIFRGTIQHVPNPFRYIQRAFTSLKSGGHIAFLATPNTDSLVYRLFGELPVSDPPRNYWMPSASTLTNALTNFGFEIVAVEYPYLDSGYARPLHDALSFARRFFGGKTNFPFKGNMMNVVAVKP